MKLLDLMWISCHLENGNWDIAHVRLGCSSMKNFRRVAPTCLSIPIQWLLVGDYCDYLFCTGHESRPVASSVLLFLTFLLSLSFPAPHRHTNVWIGNPPRGISVRKQRNTVTPMAMLDAQCSGSVHFGGFESSPPANLDSSKYCHVPSCLFYICSVCLTASNHFGTRPKIEGVRSPRMNRPHFWSSIHGHDGHNPHKI